MKKEIITLKLTEVEAMAVAMSLYTELRLSKQYCSDLYVNEIDNVLDNLSKLLCINCEATLSSATNKVAGDKK